MRASDVFHFRQFSIRHDRVTMKVGTDGVLLGAWADVSGVTNILDVGTGSGVIALMLAQRTADAVVIDAVEVSARDAEQAAENSMASPWKHRVHIHPVAIQAFRPERKYDLLVSNPPYFTNDLKPPEASRTLARHTLSLTQDTLLECAASLLAPAGHLSVILPHREGTRFTTLAPAYGFHCIRQTSFRTRVNKPVERLLLEFSRHPQPAVLEEMVLYRENNALSAEYDRLTRDFYLPR